MTVLIGGAIVIALAIAVAFTAPTEDQEEPEKIGSGDSLLESESTPQEAHPPEQPEDVGEEPAQPTFKGKRDSDDVTVPGEMLLASRVGYITSPVQQARTLGTNILCSAIAIGNEERSEITFSAFDWKLQDPNGVIVTPTILDGGRPTLPSLGELASGGSIQGDVCFEGDAAALPGEYVLFREESSFFSTRKLAWVNYL